MKVYWAVWNDLIPSAKHYPPEKAIYSFPALSDRDWETKGSSSLAK